MLNDIMDTASNILNTPGVVMVGVGIVSALVLRSIVSEANSSSPTLISYQTDSDEFPLPVPMSIYTHGSKNEKFSRAEEFIPRRTGERLTQCMRNSPPKERFPEVDLTGNEGKATVPPCVSSSSLDEEYPQENLTHANSLRKGTLFPYCQWQEHQRETVPNPANCEEPLWNFVNEQSSDPAAGDTYLIVEPPEESSESEELTTHVKSEGHSLDSVTTSSFTGPFLAPVSADDSTSQSVTWTEAFVEREPFDHELEGKASHKKSQKTKSKNEKR